MSEKNRYIGQFCKYR